MLLRYLKSLFYNSVAELRNNLEKRSLLAYKELMEHPEEFVTDVYQIAQRHDNEGFVYNEYSHPCYHSSPTCERLLSEYRNWPIPKEIKDRGEDAVRSFRAWFREHQDLLERDPEAFQMRLYMRFGILVSMSEIVIPNSGVTEMENLNLDTLAQEIDDLLKGAGRFYYANDKNNAILRIYSKRTFLCHREQPLTDNTTGYSDEEVKELLQNYETTYKDPIKRLLYEYYRVKFNPELSMEGLLLERLGLHACCECNTRRTAVSLWNN